LPALRARLEAMIPDLLAEEDGDDGGLSEVPMTLMSQQASKIRLAG
jgi:hypothetical protein